MRIVFLSVSDDLGGSEVALLEMLRALGRARPGWPLHVILPGRGPLHDRAAALGATCAVVPLPRWLARVGESGAGEARGALAARFALALRLCRAAAALPRYERALRAEVARLGPAILHTNGLKAHILGARAAGPDTRVVWHLHEYISRRPMTRRLMRWTLPRCRAIIANSESVAEDVRRAIAPSVPLTVIHNAVDLEQFTPDGPTLDLDALAGLPAAPPGIVRVGLVATYARWKGHEVFLRALARLGSGTPVRGYIIGEALYDTAGSQYSREGLTSLARQLGVSDRVGFTGFQPASSAMRSLDIVVHASTEPEPFGLVIAEAMATGRALTTSAKGGAAELIVPGVDALTHTAGDDASLAESIARLAADAEWRRQLGTAARQAAERRFDPERMASDLAALYERVGSLVAEGQPA
jgi:glycosyltransferase involved in cell wall biosynthesis